MCVHVYVLVDLSAERKDKIKPKDILSIFSKYTGLRRTCTLDNTVFSTQKLHVLRDITGYAVQFASAGKQCIST